MYYRKHEKNVSSFDTNDTIGFVNKNKTRNCQLDAAANYDSKMGKIYIRINPEMKFQFQNFCMEHGTSMNAEIISLIEADMLSN